MKNHLVFKVKKKKKSWVTHWNDENHFKDAEDFFFLPVPPPRLSCSPQRSEQLLIHDQLGEREPSITPLHRRRLKTKNKKNHTNAFCWEKANESLTRLGCRGCAPAPLRSGPPVWLWSLWPPLCSCRPSSSRTWATRKRSKRKKVQKGSR